MTVVAKQPPPQQSIRQDASMSAQPDRFGIRLQGINLLLPRDQAAEYLADITVYPIPLMPRRVRGAAQVAGRPVLVFAADVSAPDRLPVITRKSIVMLTERGSALALQVETPPVALSAVVVSAQVRPALCYEAALIAAYLGQDTTPLSMRDSAELWWDVDCVALFELLARDRRVVPLQH
jgi:hypothetical protein